MKVIRYLFLMVLFIMVVVFAQERFQQDRETIYLGGDNLVKGRVIKETADKVFVDVGFTVLEIPKKHIVKREKVKQVKQEKERQVGIYFEKSLKKKSIRELTEELGEAVVMVKTPSGLGSGFIINDKEGYIVTCYHVIEKERDITVIVFKKKGLEFENVVFKKVKIVAINPFFDLALLKLQEIGDIKLKKVYLGRLEEIKTGDVAFAIGNPHGYKRTVSEGIISTKAREREGKLYIQTTAPINPGNSGGPLFNDRGEVIGVTSWKIVGFFGGTEAMGFAINVEDIKEFLENREAFAFDKDNPNTGIKYFKPPRKSKKK